MRPPFFPWLSDVWLTVRQCRAWLPARPDIVVEGLAVIHNGWQSRLAVADGRL